MKKQLLSVLLALAIVFAPGLFVPQAQAQQGQATLTQTTLSAAVSGPAGYSGTSPTISQLVFLASTTGISAPILPGTPVSIIYMDREAMGVMTVNTTLNAVGVIRGYMGTQASPHVNGQMVLVSNVYQTNLGTGGNPIPSGLYQNDPPQGGTCNAGVPTLPWINVLTGAQWLCSTVSGTWVPGWNNPLSASSPGTTTTVASAAGLITPSGPLFRITGSAAVTGFNTATGAMTGFNSTAQGYGCFTIRADTGSTATWTAANNIAVAGTFTANKDFTFCWDAGTSKFVPNAVS